MHNVSRERNRDGTTEAEARATPKMLELFSRRIDADSNALDYAAWAAQMDCCPIEKDYSRGDGASKPASAPVAAEPIAISAAGNSLCRSPSAPTIKVYDTMVPPKTTQMITATRPITTRR